MNSLIVNSSVLTEEEIEEALVALSNKQDLMITDKETHNIEVFVYEYNDKRMILLWITPFLRRSVVRELIRS
jgi:hypothetical protein